MLHFAFHSPFADSFVGHHHLMMRATKKAMLHTAGPAAASMSISCVVVGVIASSEIVPQAILAPVESWITMVRPSISEAVLPL
mmetsp:Transcript_12239/g.27104  ORF Transcript_12239/g.27104 Transcript_12239/m.27104 type:complete len:83 (-) Transcript_12239:1687-1935(-)